MKKLNILLLVLIMLVIPFTVSAKDGKAVSETLAEATKQEEITFNHPDYKSSSSKAKIYLFRGHGCGFCHKLLVFLESIVDDYGKYFDVVSYETWYDTDNYTLMKKVASVFKESADGVPYLVIGNKTFIGYSNTYDDSIKKAIKDLYNSKDRYDVMDHLDEATEVVQNNSNDTTNDTKTTEETFNTSNYVKENKDIILTSIVALIIIAVYVVKSTLDNKKLILELESIKEEVKTLKKVEEIKPKKEVVKDNKTKTNKKVYKKKAE